MGYMASSYHLEKRRSPEALVPGTRSVIVLGVSYPLHPMERLGDSTIGLIAGYAQGEDYHTRIPGMIAPLLDFLRSELGAASQARIFTDSAPILERELAVRAGLGWIGRNSCLVNPVHGSNLLLAEVFIDRELQTDEPFKEDRCGSCHRCIDACPVSCILPNRTIDSRRCISYHTIENHHEIPPDLLQAQGNWVFGCDICQMVCPWNRHSFANGYAPSFTVEQMLALIDQPLHKYRDHFNGSALLRAKPASLFRNILQVLLNLKVLSLGQVLEYKTTFEKYLLSNGK
jgi:epoxyqueuosine reductase